MGLYKGLAKSAHYDISAKTADYTVLPEDHGKLFTTEGATAAVTFTLPAHADIPTGWFCEFFVMEDFGMVVAAHSDDADTMVVLNDVAADSVAFSTTSLIVGNGGEFISDGSKWICKLHLADGTVAVTIVTA